MTSRIVNPPSTRPTVHRTDSIHPNHLEANPGRRNPQTLIAALKIRLLKSLIPLNRALCLNRTRLAILSDRILGETTLFGRETRSALSIILLVILPSTPFQAAPMYHTHQYPAGSSSPLLGLPN